MSKSCEFSSSQQQDLQALLPNVETLKSELERLQILNECNSLISKHCPRRLHCEDIYDLSYPEIRSLETQLDQAMLTVDDKLAKVEDELLTKLIAEEEETGRDIYDKYMDENLEIELVVMRMRTKLSKQARELRISGGRQEEHDHEEMLQNIESLKSQIETLRLLNERMTGKELDGLSYFELEILSYELSDALFRVKYAEWRKRLAREESISSLDTATYDDHQGETSSRLGSLEIN